MYEQNVLSVVKDWQILSFSAKWLKGEQITEINHKTDKYLVKSLWRLMNQAHVIVGQNGDAFDIKKINARFAFYGMPPPAPYKTVDTLKVARRYFAFSSNKLDDLARYLGIGNKIHTGGFKLWLDCMKGDKKALRLMKAYNKHDVILLEKVYLKLLPWISNHPNLANGIDKPVCPKCQSKRLWSGGLRIRKTTTSYRLFRCLDCKGWIRGNTNIQEYKPLLNA